MERHLVTFPKFRPESDIVTQVDVGKPYEEVLIYLNVDDFPPGSEEEQLSAHESTWRAAAEDLYRQQAGRDVRFENPEA